MTTDSRTSEPTRAQIEAAARKWIERLDSDAHWARSPGAREKASSEKKILEWLLEAAAGVAPPAPSEYAYCPIHGDLLAANRSYRCGNAPTGHEYSRHTIPLYGMLDLWMALYGTSHPQFDEFYEKHGYAETWARLLAEVRSRAAAGVAPPAESAQPWNDEADPNSPRFDSPWEKAAALLSTLRGAQFDLLTRRDPVEVQDEVNGLINRLDELVAAMLAAPVQPSSTVDEAALSDVLSEAVKTYAAYYKPEPFETYAARAVAEYLTGGTK